MMSKNGIIPLGVHRDIDLTPAQKRQLVNDLCGEDFTGSRGVFRLQRVLSNDTVELCWMGQHEHPIESLSLGDAVQVILTQSPQHRIVEDLLWKAA